LQDFKGTDKAREAIEDELQKTMKKVAEMNEESATKTFVEESNENLKAVEKERGKFLKDIAKITDRNSNQEKMIALQRAEYDKQINEIKQSIKDYRRSCEGDLDDGPEFIFNMSYPTDFQTLGTAAKLAQGALNAASFRAYLDAKIRIPILGLSTNTKIDIGPTYAKIYTRSPIFNIFSSIVNANIDLSNPLEGLLEVGMESQALTKLSDLLMKAAKLYEKEVAGAIKDVSKAQKDANTALNKAKKDASDALRKANDYAAGDLKKAKSDLASAHRHLNEEKAGLEREKRKMSVSKGKIAAFQRKLEACGGKVNKTEMAKVTQQVQAKIKQAKLTKEQQLQKMIKDNPSLKTDMRILRVTLGAFTPAQLRLLNATEQRKIKQMIQVRDMVKKEIDASEKANPTLFNKLKMYDEGLKEELDILSKKMIKDAKPEPELYEVTKIKGALSKHQAILERDTAKQSEEMALLKAKKTPTMSKQALQALDKRIKGYVPTHIGPLQYRLKILSDGYKNADLYTKHAMRKEDTLLRELDEAQSALKKIKENTRLTKAQKYRYSNEHTKKINSAKRALDAARKNKSIFKAKQDKKINALISYYAQKAKVKAGQAKIKAEIAKLGEAIGLLTKMNVFGTKSSKINQFNQKRRALVTQLKTIENVFQAAEGALAAAWR